MQLIAGQRFRLQDENKFAVLKSGKVEVYAVTRDEKSFRKFFLMELTANAAAYPSFDDFENIDVEVYAVQDSEFEIFSFDEIPADVQIKWMRTWFKKLVALPYFRLFADKGDDILISWIDGSVLNGGENNLDDLLEDFSENEKIFSMFVGIRFKSEDKNTADRLEIRKYHKQNLLNEAIGNLLGEEPLYREKTGSGDKLEETAFLIKNIAKALGMPVNNLQLPPEIVRKLDQIGLIRRLVQKCNMQMRLITLVPEWYTKDSGVIIGYYGENKELAAFIPKGPGDYRLLTAKNPEEIIINEEVAKKINESAFECYAGLPLRQLTFPDLFKFAIERSWSVDIKAVLFASFIAGLVPIVSPIITESIFADIIPILDREGLVVVTQVSIVSSFTLAAVALVRAIAVMRITSRFDMSIEAALWGRILALPTSFFRQFQSGELTQRVLGMESLKAVLNNQVVSTIFNMIFSVWSLILMCYYSLKLTALAVVLWLVYFGLTFFIYRRVGSFQRKMVEAKNLTSGIVQQIFTGLPKFRIQGAEEQAYYLWAKVFGEEWKWNLKLRWQNNYNTIISAIQPLIFTFMIFCMTFYVLGKMDGAKFVTEIEYPKFLAFLSAFTGLNAAVVGLTGILGTFFTIRPHIENLRPILEAIPEIAEDKPDAEVLSGAIEVNHLSFSYVEGGPNIVDDMSFRIVAGENVAIVGKSGCGKSTLLRLMLGFEKPKTGAIYYDGQDLSELNVSSVRSQMGVVLQNGQLMTGDIFTNIIGTTSLTMDDAWDAARAAGLEEDIKKMPMGMHTVISEGSSNISGGQRQRILIARALAAKPSILIFDEATSALDNRTQAIVTESLNKRHVTRIIVAHRLSTIRDCDRVIVLDKGKIAESGTFDELVAKGGIFSDLVKRQIA